MPAGEQTEPAPRPESSPPPVKLTPRQKVLGFLATFLVIVVTTGIGSILVDVPPTLPNNVPGVLLWLAGALLLAVAAVVATFFDKVRTWAATAIAKLPERHGQRKKKFWRKRAAIFVVLLAVAAGIAALVPGPGDGLETGTIRLLSGFDLSPSDPRQVLINQWNQSHPDNQVQVIDAAGPTDQQYTRMKNDVTKTKEADIYLLDHIWMSEFITDGYLRPLDENLRQSKDDDFFPNVLATCKDTYGNKDGLWALPLNTDAGLMFYRKDLSGVGEPASWDDYYGGAAKEAMPAAAAAVADGQLKFANAAQFANTEILTVTALEAIWAAGGEVVNQDGKPVYNADRSEVEFDEQARQGLRRLAAAYRDPTIIAPDAKNNDETSAFARFKSGEALYMRNWPVTYDRLKDSRDVVPVPFEVAALPHPSVLGGQNLAMSAATRRPRAAQAFMEFLTSAPSQLILLDVGGFAASRPAVYREVANATRPYANALRIAVEDARPRPVNPNYLQFSEEFRRGVQRALNNGGEFEPDFPRLLADKLR